jgi:hypothetical protein
MEPKSHIIGLEKPAGKAASNHLGRAAGDLGKHEFAHRFRCVRDRKSSAVEAAGKERSTLAGQELRRSAHDGLAVLNATPKLTAPRLDKPCNAFLKRSWNVCQIASMRSICARRWRLQPTLSICERSPTC